MDQVVSPWTCPYSFNISKLLPLLLDVEEDYQNILIPPSRLNYELQVSTEDRLQRLSKPTRKYRVTTELNTFSRTPDMVVFQNFSSNRVYTTTLSLQNTHKCSKCIRVVEENSAYFSLEYPVDSESTSARIAPGMVYNVRITFKPGCVKDYLYKITFVTEEERFEVPVYAIGHRPILNLPDVITLKPTAIGVRMYKSLALHNFGKAMAFFVTQCKGPFFVEPERGVLKPQATMEIKVICTPNCLRCHLEDDIFFVCDDIRLKVKVQCEVVEADIYMHDDKVSFGEIFMNLQKQEIVKISNRSPYTVNFYWSLYKSNAIDALEKNRLSGAMEGMAGLMKTKHNRLDFMNIIDAEGHNTVIEDQCLKAKQELEEKWRFAYKNEIFTIIPCEGVLHPNQTLDFLVLFSPKTNDYYSSWAYLDIGGKPERLPLSLSGVGRGPVVIFNANTLNINNVYMNARHEYQIVVKNDGHIPATVVFRGGKTEFGGDIECVPTTRYLSHFDTCKSFVIKFSSSVQGQFVEKVQFVIEESKEIIHFLLIGNVVCPLLKMSRNVVDFGNIPFGQCAFQAFNLVNDAQVPINYTISVDESKNMQAQWSPREYVVQPFSNIPILVETVSSMAVCTNRPSISTDIRETAHKISFVVDTVADVETAIWFRMWGSDKYRKSVPVYINPVVPVLECDPSEVVMNFCFLDFEYKRKIKLKNVTSYSGDVKYTPMEEPENMVCQLNITEAHIDPYGEILIELTVMTSELGLHEYDLVFEVHGAQPKEYCKVSCNGQGPVLIYAPEVLNFGNVTLLETTSCNLTITNESPIPAEINISTKPNLPFFVEITEVTIASELSAVIPVHCYLKDAGKYESYVRCTITKGETIDVKIFAIGVGCSILCEPDIVPEYDAGFLLTHQSFRFDVKFTNLGKKFTKMLWTRQKSLRCLKVTEEIDSIFSMTPNQFELATDQYQVMEIAGMSKNVRAVEEDFYCFSTCDKGNKPILLMSFVIKAFFIEPEIEFSKCHLEFMVSINEEGNLSLTSATTGKQDAQQVITTKPCTNLEGEGSVILGGDSGISTPVCSESEEDDSCPKYSVLHGTVEIKNTTPIPLKMRLRTSPTFYVYKDGESVRYMSLEIDGGDTYTVRVKFVPEIYEKRYRKDEGNLTLQFDSHPKSEKLPLYSELFYPTVVFIPKEIDFKCVPPLSVNSMSIIIKNITCMPVRFTWTLREEFFHIEKLDIVTLDDGKTVEEIETLRQSDTHESIMKSSGYLDDTVCKVESIKQLQLFAMQEDKRTPSARKSHGTNVPLILGMEKKMHALDPLEACRILERLYQCTWDDDKCEMEKARILRAMTETHRSNDVDLEFVEVLPEEPPMSDPWALRNILTIEPMEGVLSPYEYTSIMVGFCLPPDVRVDARAVCSIENGEDEQLIVKGISSRILYTLDKRNIEFGRKLCCEICEETVTLTNPGYGSFKYQVKCDHDCSSDIVPKAGWLCVTPIAGYLGTDEEVVLNIRYFPGVAGEFKKSFTMQIGYLEPCEVSVHGFSAPAQITLTLLRPAIYNIPVTMQYFAIAGLTSDYLRTQKVKSANLPRHSSTSGHSICDTAGLNESIFQEMAKEWVIITDNDVYPSEVDIELVLERALLNQALSNDIDTLQEHTVTRKSNCIPRFMPPSYTLDFGYVPLGKPVCYTVLIMNYGPVDTVVAKRLGKKAKTMSVEFKPRKLAVGEMTELFVIFSPTVDEFGLEDNVIEKIFTLMVRHGGLIPVAVKAKVTRPQVDLGHELIHFGSVKVGCAFRKSIYIKNSGHLDANWAITVTSSSKAYLIIPTEGHLSPGKKQILTIIFIPKTQGAMKAVVMVDIEGNRDAVRLRLIGEGVMHDLSISTTALEFPPALPFSSGPAETFTVKNMSPFPVEYCFPNYDEEYGEEQFLIQTYLVYNNLTTLLIPERPPGGKLPEIFNITLTKVIDEIKEKTLRESGEETLEDPLAMCDKEQLITIVSDYVNNLEDNLEAAETDGWITVRDDETKLTIVEPPKVDDNANARNALFVIVHGGPTTEYHKVACKISQGLGVPLYSIDYLILEELVNNATPVASEINAYIDIRIGIVDEKDNEDFGLPTEDEYDVLARKISMAQTGKRITKKELPTERKKGKKGSENSSGKSSDKKSGKGKGRKKEDDSPTLINIPMELLVSLLKDKLSRFDEMVIGGLENMFIKQYNDTFYCLLQAIGDVRFVQLILLNYTLGDYVARRDAELRKIDEEKKKQLEEKEAEQQISPVSIKQSSVRSVNAAASSTKTKSAKDKSSGKTSDKTSTSKRKEKPVNYLKQIMKELPKSFKAQLEAYEDLMGELIHLCEFWDKTRCLLTVPYIIERKKSKGGSGKNSTQDSKQSSKKARQNSSEKIQSSDQDMGCLLWLFRDSAPKDSIEYPELVADILMKDVNLEKYKAKKERLLECPFTLPPDEVFSVLQRLNKYAKHTADAFSICNHVTVEGQRSVRSQTSHLSAQSDRERRKYKKTKKRSFDRRSSALSAGSSRLSDTDYCTPLVPRQILLPGEIKRYDVSFNPLSCGIYRYEYVINTIGTNMRYNISCEAISALPQLDFDPEKVFPTVMLSSAEKELTDRLVYTIDDNVFDFGYVLEGARDEELRYEVKLNLVNDSPMPCDLIMEIREDSQFYCDPQSLTIAANDKDNISIYLQPSKNEVIISQLYVSTKNNPKVEIVNLRALPTTMDFSVSPKTLNFEKVPVKTTCKKKFTLTNSSPIDVHYKLVTPKQFTEKFNIRKREGTVQSYSINNVSITLTPQEEEIYSKKHLDLELYDKLLSETEPFDKVTITVLGDSQEYNIECENDIDLGEIQGRKEHAIDFAMFNKGNFNVNVVFVPITIEKDEKIRKYFRIEETNVTLPPQKETTVKIFLNATQTVGLSKLPVFVCNIIDTAKPDTVISFFEITFTAKIFLSRFEICPAIDMYFGYQPVATTRTQSLELKNTGRFPFDYSIISLKMMLDRLAKQSKGNLHNGKTGKGKKEKGSEGSKSSNKSNKSNIKSDKSNKSDKSAKKDKGSGKDKSKSSKESKQEKGKKKDKPKPMTKLQIPGFLIFSSTGTVHPNETEKIEVQCTPLEAIDYEDTIVINVSEPRKSDLNGRYLKLHAKGSEPRLDLNDIDRVFREHYIVDSLEDFTQCIGACCAYVKSESVLYFKNACVRKTSSAKIYLKNVGDVIANVVLKVDNKHNYQVFPSECIIEAYNTGTVTITFTPDSINLIEGKLEITYNATTNNKYVLKLMGESCIPRVVLLEPIASKKQEDERLIMFPPTFVGEQNEQKVVIKNVGPIGAKVILEICENNEEVLSLHVAEDTRQYLNIADYPPFVDVKYSTLVNLPPSKVGNFKVFFKPTSDKEIAALLRIHTVDNIFEIIKIELIGIGFYHEIRFDLPMSYYMSKSEASPSFSYDLDFGFTSLNRLVNRTFTISNLSFNNTYRFEFCSISAVMCIPRKGHLKPMATKSIVASFCTSKPIALEKVNINCNVVQIEYLEPATADTSWDDRQEMMLWKMPSEEELSEPEDENGSKMELVTYSTEPKMVVKSDFDSIKLFVSGKADYSIYLTTMKEILFPNTFLNEQSTVEFEVQNGGIVPLQITWMITDFEQDCIQRPFSAGTESLQQQRHECSLRSTCSSTSLTSLFSPSTPSGDPNSTRPETVAESQPKVPFRITPEFTTIPVNAERRFQVTFAPLDAGYCTLRLISNIPSLNPSLTEIDVAMMGKAIVPEYYFELKDTDYLNRRPYIQNCNKADFANCKIIEFLSVGVGSACTRNFNFVNPNVDDVIFKLSPKAGSNRFTYFSCKNNSGIVKGGKKFEICFTFTPQELGAYEEFYQFDIDGKSSTTFLLAGQCREPNVYFKTPFITIEPTLLHVPKSVMVEMRNDEYQECSFRFCKGSLIDDNCKRKLEVIPMSGSILPRSETSLKVMFNAEEPGPASFDLQCNVKLMKEPLHLGISASCLTVVCKVFYTDIEGDLILLKSDGDNCMNFRNVMLKKPAVQKISIANEGTIGFYYHWQLDKNSANHYSCVVDVSIEEEKGFVAAGTSTDSVLTLTPQRKTIIQNMKVILQISYGPKYVININATAGEPLFRFSFLNYNFGYCIVQKEKTKYYSTSLVCKNYDTQPLVIENLFESNANLTVEFKSAKIQPNNSVTIPIYFHPLTVGKHHVTVPFDVSTSKYAVNVDGEAVKVNIQLVDILDKYIDIGSLKVGSSKKRVVQVLNKTPTEVDAYFALWDQLPIHKRPQEKAEMTMKLPKVPEPVVKDTTKGKRKEDKGGNGKKKDKSKDDRNTEKSSRKASKKEVKKDTKKEERRRSKTSDSDILTGPKINLTEPPKMDMSRYVKISPKTSIHMLPDKKYEFIVEFNAEQRLVEFAEKIFYEVQDYAVPLCVIKGSYIAPEFSLDKNMITFANVVLGCHRDMYILLQNTGDLKGRFKWVIDHRMDQFEIHPMDGVIMPKTVMKISITYRPKVIQCQLILKNKCIINGVTHLPFTIIANSVDLPKPTEHLNFECPVRTDTCQYVTIYNNTKVTWNLKPVLHGEEFVIPDKITIPAETDYMLKICYAPRTTNKSGPHKATIFLALPEGHALLYDLTGITQPPIIVDNITREIPCKKLHTETLKIRNWLNRQQTFTVETLLLSTPTIKSIYRVTGKEVIAVPPNSTKKYNWNIYVVNEESLDFKVLFTNPDSKEYLFYEISLKVLPSGPLDAILIETCVRELKKVTIKLENPINISVTFINECPLSEIMFQRIVTIPPHSTHNLELCYFPIKPNNSKYNFEAKSEQLGVFIYSLVVKANPPPLEKVVHFESELGEKSFCSVSLRNNFTVPVELVGKFENAAFSLESSTTALPGEEGKYVFCFEPFELGVAKCEAVLYSPITGDFIYPLIGECTPPKPKGPYNIKSGGTVTVNFTNPFLEPKVFHFECDNKEFLIRNSDEEIRGRKSFKVIVNFVSQKQINTPLVYPSTAKMTIRCLDPELQHINWLYYLQGD